MRRLFYCDHHELALPAGHKFPASKYARLRELLAADGFYRFEQAPPATISAIQRVHDPVYVRDVLEGTLPPSIVRRIGLPWSQGLVARTLASVGGTLAAVEDAMKTGFGGNLAGGTHHAFRSEGAGFCVFNDLAIAVETLRAHGRIRRAAVIDLDVHQGDGTAALFANDPDVLTLSIHGQNNFPFRKQRSTIDVALADGTGDDEYLRVLSAVLPRVFEFRPDFVLYQSGVDALATDALGRLALSREGLCRRDHEVMTAARAYGAPFAITLGGGYAEPLDDTVAAHAGTYRAAAAIFPDSA